MVDFARYNYFDAFEHGRQVGRQRRREQASDNAMARYASGDTAGGIQDLMAVDPQAAATLQQQQREQQTYDTQQRAGAQAASGDIAGAQQTALSGGQFDLHGQLAQLSTEQREIAQQHASTIASIGIRLLDMPAEQRVAQIQALKPALIDRGFKPEEIDAIASDPSDARLNAAIGSAMTLKDTLDQQNKARDDAETRRYHDLMADKPLVLGNGAVAVDRDDGNVIARNAKTFAPSRAKAGSSKAAPWAMDWSK